ncbi:MAG: RNA polymerase sigma factor [Alphaproteobacteria bacterium]|nr:RNA polymerase sigma factor [Alphaproteobacteria bacterium]MBO6864361.1 RNA polymerase sigma factor [Alphaproteobacteria bacterium]
MTLRPVSIDDLYRRDSRQVLATLIRLLGDFDLAEEALQDAFAVAAERWARDGVPDNPRAWLVSTGRFKAIDKLRRRARFDAAQGELADRLYGEEGADDAPEDRPEIEDDYLRLIFTCCHPALAADARIALTLREVCGLTTEEIARAFLTGAPTLAQRIVRAKAKIRDARIPYAVPEADALAERLGSVLQVVYLVFNEGYSASSGDSLTRVDLTGEAIRLARLLRQMLAEPEVTGLLALMLLQDSRREARATPDGDLILLDEQDRSLWRQDAIDEGLALLGDAFRSGRVGPYTLQAAIAAEHARAARPEDTDWGRIVQIYDALTQIVASPVVDLNRAVAVAMRDGPAAGLAQIEAITAQGQLRGYHLLHSAKADLLRRLGRYGEARDAYRTALNLAEQEPEKRFLTNRLRDLPA